MDERCLWEVEGDAPNLWRPPRDDPPYKLLRQVISASCLFECVDDPSFPEEAPAVFTGLPYEWWECVTQSVETAQLPPSVARVTWQVPITLMWVPQSG